jgi:hypothetical protein
MLGEGRWWPVGSDEDRQIAEDNWASLAQAKGFRCSACGRPTAYDERELYFRTGRCSECTVP